MWQETIKRKQINQPTKYFTKPAFSVSVLANRKA